MFGGGDFRGSPARWVFRVAVMCRRPVVLALAGGLILLHAWVCPPEGHHERESWAGQAASMAGPAPSADAPGSSHDHSPHRPHCHEQQESDGALLLVSLLFVTAVAGWTVRRPRRRVLCHASPPALMSISFATCVLRV